MTVCFQDIEGGQGSSELLPEGFSGPRGGCQVGESGEVDPLHYRSVLLYCRHLSVLTLSRLSVEVFILNIFIGVMGELYVKARNQPTCLSFTIPHGSQGEAAVSGYLPDVPCQLMPLGPVEI